MVDLLDRTIDVFVKIQVLNMTPQKENVAF